MARHAVHLKRIYDAPAPGDGQRILVDRLWPRGVSKEKAALDLWLKDVAPSNELRKSFGHDPAKWDDFHRRYTAELQANKDAVDQLSAALKKGTVTLLYGARDTEHNEAVVLRDFLQK